MGRKKATVAVSGATGTYTSPTIIGKMTGFSVKTASASTTFKFHVDDKDGFRWFTKSTTVTHGFTYKDPPIECGGPMTFTFTEVSADENVDILILIADNARFLG